MSKKEASSNQDRKKNKDGYYRSTFYFEKRQYAATGKTQREADKKASAKLSKLERGEVGISNNMTVARWAKEWLETYKQGNVTPKVYKDYEQKVGYIISEIGSLRLKEVKDIHLQKILNHFSGYNTDYVARVRQLMKGMFRQARVSRLIFYDPSECLILPKTTRGSHRSITDFEREHILKVAGEHVAGLWVKTMLYCGLRPGETIPLTWNSIDFEKRRLSVKEAKESGSDNIKGPKSDAGVRDIPIPDHLLKCFEEACGEPFEYVFPRPGTNIIHTETSLKYYWKSFKKQVDISMGAVYGKKKAADGKMRTTLLLSVVAKDLTPYCLRHTYGTDLQDAGVPINVAKHLMGHSDISTTGNIYTHMTDETMDIAADTINKHHNKDNANNDANENPEAGKRA